MKNRRFFIRPMVEELERRELLNASGLLPEQAAPPAHAAAGRYIVTLQPGVDAQAFAQELRGQGRAVLHVYGHALNGLAFQGTALGNDPRIASIEVDQILTVQGQVVPTGVERIGLSADNFNGGQTFNVGIAILDTGIDASHPDLNVVGGRNFSGGNSNNWNDVNGHGTHVAGTAAALDNGFGVVGVAPGADLYAVKVLGNNGGGWLSDIAAGVDWVTANVDKIHVANMSLGGLGTSSVLRTAIQNSVNVGIIYVVAAGNSSMDVYGSDGNFNTTHFLPAAYPEVMTVSAVADSDGKPGGLGPNTSWGPDDTLATFSNFSTSVISGNPVNSLGAAIDVAAPGVNILSTIPGGGYGTGSGTSMASPHVAGAVARYIAQHFPNTRDYNGDGVVNAADVYHIRQELIDLAQPMDVWHRTGPTTDRDSNPEPMIYIGWGADVPPAPTTVQITAPNDGATVSGEVTITAAASADVEQVEFFVNNSSIGMGTNGTNGWSVAWDTNTVADDSYTIMAVAIGSEEQPVSDSISVTVANNPVEEPPGDANDMYVWDITWATQQRGRNTDLIVTIWVKQDTNGEAEESDEPAANVSVEFQLTHLNSGESWLGSGNTNSDGMIAFQLRKAPSGDYKGEVIDLSRSSLTWNDELDQSNPSYYTLNSSSLAAGQGRALFSLDGFQIAFASEMHLLPAVAPLVTPAPQANSNSAPAVNATPALAAAAVPALPPAVFWQTGITPAPLLPQADVWQPLGDGTIAIFDETAIEAVDQVMSELEDSTYLPVMDESDPRDAWFDFAQDEAELLAV